MRTKTSGNSRNSSRFLCRRQPKSQGAPAGRHPGWPAAVWRCARGNDRGLITTQSCRGRAKMLFCMQTSHREFTGQIRVAPGPFGGCRCLLPREPAIRRSLERNVVSKHHSGPSEAHFSTKPWRERTSPFQETSVRCSDNDDHNAAEPHSAAMAGQETCVAARVRLKGQTGTWSCSVPQLKTCKKGFTSDLQNLISLAS